MKLFTNVTGEKNKTAQFYHFQEVYDIAKPATNADFLGCKVCSPAACRQPFLQHFQLKKCLSHMETLS